jgi:hypothetical protein
MKLLAIINFLITVFGFVTVILSGILLIRHRQLIFYFKDAFGFIREDYTAEIDVKYGNIFTESIAAIKFGFRSLKSSKSEDIYSTDKTNEINQIIVLLGKLMVLSGVLGVLTAFLSSFWMLFISRLF